MADWNADQYLMFANERTQPAIDLANRIGVADPARIIDIGCGPGNSTAVLRARYPKARILGVDNSPDMLNAARAAYPDLEFALCDANTDLGKLGGGFDVVFSNACLQWLPDHDKVLRELMGLLRPGGVLAVQIPVNHDEPIHRIIVEVAERPEWVRYLRMPRVFHTLTDSRYFDLLSGLSTGFEMWRTTYFHKLGSHADIMEWYRGTGLRPYLDALPEGLRGAFEAEVYTGVVDAYPVQANGSVIFRFPRLFLTAVR